MAKNKLIRVTTVPISLRKLLEGQLNFMQKEYEVIAVSADEEDLTKFGKEISVPTNAVEMTREITPGKDLSAVYQLYRFFKKEKPLIVHTHTPKAGIAGMMAAKMAGVPIRLHTVAGLPLLEARGFRRKILEVVEKITFACATKVYPNSKKILEFLKDEKFTSEKKLKVIGKGSTNGIDTDFFNPEKFSEKEKLELRLQLNIPKEDVVFIFIGRLVGDKGINELVSAFEKLQENFGNISLLLVGNYEEALDPLKKSTIEVIANHPKIIEAGYQDDVRPYLFCTDVLSFPSYREGFPNVVMQAGAMGLPAIVTNINGCNEIIEDGKNGLIIPVRNENALLNAMEKMLKDPASRKHMHSKAREIIVDNYERREVWELLLKEYKTLEKKLG